MNIEVKYVGTDFWDREVYQNVENGRFYKKEEGAKRFYTTDEFEGEPISLLDESINVIVLPE